MKAITSTPRRFAATLAVCFVALFGVIAAAQAQTPTVINVLPYTINQSGPYVLTSDLNSSATSGNLITINASNVTIDFQGHYIAGPTTTTTQTTYGVRANEQSNVTLKNGVIAYCYYGVFITGNNQSTTNAVGMLVDSMRVTYCTYVGISLQYCLASRITNCQVSRIGVSTNATAYGIEAYNGGVVAANNTVSNILATTNAYGITNYGAFARQNTISSATYGVIGTGKYQDNLTLSCTTPYSGGTDAGGNN